MAITHSSTARTALAALIRDGIDAAATPGKLKLFDAGSTLLAEITFNDPCGTVTAGVLTYSLTPAPADNSANATGTAATFSITDGDNNVIYSGTVTATGGGGDVTLPSVSITATEAVQLNNFSYTASL